MSEMAIDKPLTVIKMDEKKLLPYLFIAIVLMIMGVTMIPLCIGLAVFYVVLYLYQKNCDLVRIYSEYSEIKPAPIRSSWLIPNKAIIGVRQEKKLIILDVEQEGKTVARKIPLLAFTESDAEKVTMYYQNVLKANSINAH